MMWRDIVCILMTNRFRCVVGAVRNVTIVDEIQNERASVEVEATGDTSAEKLTRPLKVDHDIK